jgi:hypothetical protein
MMATVDRTRTVLSFIATPAFFPKAEMPRLTIYLVVVDNSRRAGAHCQFGSSSYAGTRVALAHIREAQPEISLAWAEKMVPYTPAQMPHFLDGLKMAGLQ